MKIKIGKVREDVTAFGNRYWIQIEDTKNTANEDMKELVGKDVSVVIGEMSAIDDLIQEVELL